MLWDRILSKHRFRATHRSSFYDPINGPSPHRTPMRQERGSTSRSVILPEILAEFKVIYFRGRSMVLSHTHRTSSNFVADVLKNRHRFVLSAVTVWLAPICAHDTWPLWQHLRTQYLAAMTEPQNTILGRFMSPLVYNRFVFDVDKVQQQQPTNPTHQYMRLATNSKRSRLKHREKRPRPGGRTSSSRESPCSLPRIAVSNSKNYRLFQERSRFWNLRRAIHPSEYLRW